MIDLSKIAETIRVAREQKGLTQEEVAKKCGKSLRTIRNYEANGVQNLVALDSMCRCLGLTLEVKIKPSRS